MLTARLLVPLGAPLQLSSGETLPPVQPKPLNTCSLAIVPPSLMSVLVKVMLCACAAVAPRAVRPSAIQTVHFVTAIPPLQKARALLLTCRCDGSHSNFRDGAEAREAIGEGSSKTIQATIHQAFPGGHHERSNPHPDRGH